MDYMQFNKQMLLTDIDKNKKHLITTKCIFIFVLAVMANDIYRFILNKTTIAAFIIGILFMVVIDTFSHLLNIKRELKSYREQLKSIKKLQDNEYYQGVIKTLQETEESYRKQKKEYEIAFIQLNELKTKLEAVKCAG